LSRSIYVVRIYKLILQVNCSKTLEILNEIIYLELLENVKTDEFKNEMENINISLNYEKQDTDAPFQKAEKKSVVESGNINQVTY